MHSLLSAWAALKPLAPLLVQVSFLLGAALERRMDQAMLCETDSATSLVVRPVADEASAGRSVRNMILRYAASTMLQLRNQQFVSLSVDASRIGRRNFLIGAVVLPDNRAAWAPPQVPCVCPLGALGPPPPPSAPSGADFRVPRKASGSPQQGLRAPKKLRTLRGVRDFFSGVRNFGLEKGPFLRVDFPGCPQFSGPLCSWNLRVVRDFRWRIPVSGGRPPPPR